jgi:hypothetical protein
MARGSSTSPRPHPAGHPRASRPHQEDTTHPPDLATILGRAGVDGFANEILLLMANPLDRT